MCGWQLKTQGVGEEEMLFVWSPTLYQWDIFSLVIELCCRTWEEEPIVVLQEGFHNSKWRTFGWTTCESCPSSLTHRAPGVQ